MCVKDHQGCTHIRFSKPIDTLIEAIGHVFHCLYFFDILRPLRYFQRMLELNIIGLFTSQEHNFNYIIHRQNDSAKLYTYTSNISEII